MTALERQRRYKAKHRDKINSKQRNYRSNTPEAQAKYRKNKYDKQKRKIEEYKHGKSCVRCGFDDIRALVFHHIDPSKKEFGISAKIGKISIARIMTEIAKCELLCANCHSIEHYQS